MSAEQAASVEEPVAQTVRGRRERQDRKPKRQPRYHVILWDDDDHTYAYVVAMMMQIFGHPMEKGYQIALDVDTQGRAVVLTTTKEHAELKRDQIHAFGKDGQIDKCQGAMWATLEPVE